MFESKVKIMVSGSNLRYFITRLIRSELNILKAEYPFSNKTFLTLSLEDYKKIKAMRTTCEIKVVRTYGLLRLKEIIKLNMIMIIMVVIGYFSLLFLSNVIFEVKIVHENKEIRDMIKNDLEDYGLKTFTIKKDFDTLKDIKNKILAKRKDSLEWLEINVSGVEYIIRVEERKINKQEDDTTPSNIIAVKNTVLKRISVEQGQKIKDINDSVVPGEIIISGTIQHGESIKAFVKSKGKIFGEVWYQVKVEYPLVYRETIYTSNQKTLLSLQVLRKNIDILNIRPFAHKKIKEEVLISNPILPINLIKQTQREVIYKEQILTEAEAIKAAQTKAREGISIKLKAEEEILKQKTLKIDKDNSKIVLYEFFSILENVGKEEPITDTTIPEQG